MNSRQMVLNLFCQDLNAEILTVITTDLPTQFFKTMGGCYLLS